MDYEKLHKDTIAKLQQMVNSGQITIKTACSICADFVLENEDERIRKAIEYAIGQSTHSDGTLINGVSSEEVLTWLEKQNKQNPNEWSEEDKEIINWLGNEINGRYYIDSPLINPIISKTLNWLKSLRPQITVTDEELIKARNEAYNDALDKLEYHYDTPTFNDGWSAAIWYLKKKNAQFKNTWKPSEEQIKVLEFFIPYVTKCNVVLQKSKDTLLSLLSDLKKLREG